MATRKRTLLKPKSVATPNGSSARQINSRNKINSTMSGNNDFSLYLRLSILVLLGLAIGGFLLYPDIVSIVKAVQQKSFNNAVIAESETTQETLEDELLNTQQHISEKDTASYLEDSSDEAEELVSISDDTDTGDLMEDEETNDAIKNKKYSQSQTVEKTTRTETESNKGNQQKKTEQSSDKTELDKDTPSTDSSKQDQINKSQKSKTVRKKGPIILNGDNNQIVLDASQIKFENSASNENVNRKPSQDNKRKVSSETQHNKDKNESKPNKEVKFKTVNNEKQGKGTANTDIVLEEAKNFNSTFQKTFTPKKIFADGRRIPPVELLHQKPSNSSVRVFLFDDFLSQQECDGLIKAHDSHVKASDKPPILCFDSIATLRTHIKDLKKKIHVTPNDFTKGTKCVNASFSLQLQTWMKSNWSLSTAFYPGESTFSKVVSYRIKEAMGLDPASGGKFQITSYPEGKAYKEHTDCVLGGVDQRDRVVSVLMYLSNVEEGGETTFPELGIWVRPKKGRALVWNNMSPKGVCEEHSKHVASVVKKGSKYILIRCGNVKKEFFFFNDFAAMKLRTKYPVDFMFLQEFAIMDNQKLGYYYKTFYSLGRRPPAPELPERDPGQPMVNCDEYNSGSCRWYDEWSYEHLLDYGKNKLKLI